MIQILIKIDYSAIEYGSLQEVTEYHTEAIRGVATLLEVFKDKDPVRQYLVGLKNIGAWEARGIADELVNELQAEGYDVEMEKI